MIDFDRLQSIETDWESIEQSYRLSSYEAPQNREEEQQKVFTAYADGKIYNPQFIYQTPPEYPVARIREFMAHLTPDQSPLEALYYEKAAQELRAIRSVQTHAPDVITGTTCLAYGLPDRLLLAEAQNLLSCSAGPDESQRKDKSAEQAAAWMQPVLEHMNIREWQVVVYSPMNAAMSVNNLNREIRIRKGTLFTKDALRRLLVHEVGVHVLRWINGTKQPIRLFYNGFTSYADTEEGLAVYSEDKAGLLEINTLRKYAGRVLAAHLALNRPFFKVFEAIAPILGQEMAFDIVARAKRGFTDTAQPGAHTKDIVYLRGYLQVKAHLEQYPDDYPLLFTGKMGLQHLPLVRELVATGIVKLPTLLPQDISSLVSAGD